jgi:hypothetical protein
MKWPWSGRPTGRATDCNSAYAGSNPARSNAATGVATATTEWVEIAATDFTVALGRNAVDQEVHFRVTGEQNGVTARIEWSLEAAWVRKLLDKWFPDKPLEKAP